MSLGIVIPNYNGENLLKRYLPSVLRAAEHAGAAHVLLVDDGSADKSIDSAREVSSEIVIERKETNSGFGDTVNRGASMLDTNYLAVLMTDIELLPDSLSNAMEMFDADTFAVSLHLKETEDGANAAVTALPYNRGLFHISFPELERPGVFNSVSSYVAFAVGGAMIVDKRKFDALQGFDPIYNPYSWEDIDLCWRAWKKGWPSVNCHDAVAYHRHPHTTISSNEKLKRVRHINTRNGLMFLLKNISDQDLLSEHRRMIRLMLLKRMLKWDFSLNNSLKEAHALIRQHGAQSSADSETVVSDKELVHYISCPHVFGNPPVPFSSVKEC